MMKKRITALAAICSSVFLFAACEPRDDSPGAGGEEEPASPSYGEPDRPEEGTGTSPPDQQDDPMAPQDETGTQQQEDGAQSDEWEDDAGTTN